MTTSVPPQSSQSSPDKRKNPDDPDHTVILVSDDGNIYKLNKDDWQKKEFLLDPNTGTTGIVDQLTTFGSYVAFVDKSLAIGIGACCTVVNLRAILRGAGVAAPKPSGASGGKGAGGGSVHPPPSAAAQQG